MNFMPLTGLVCLDGRPIGQVGVSRIRKSINVEVHVKPAEMISLRSSITLQFHRT